MTDSLNDICKSMKKLNVSTTSSPQFIRPRIRTRKQKQIVESKLYSPQELEAMKHTFIGKIINDIYKH